MSTQGGLCLLQELENKSPNLQLIKDYTATLQRSSTTENDPELLKALGHCYLIQNNEKVTHEHYQKALNLKGTEDPELWYGIGLMYYKNSNYTYAEPSFLRVLSLDPNFCKASSIQLKLGLIYKRFAHYSEAIKHFSECSLEDKPAGLSQIGFCYKHLGCVSEALDTFRAVHDKFRSPYSALCLGWHLSQTDLQSAQACLSEGLSACPKDTHEELDLLYALAQVLYKKKEISEASNYYLKVLNKNSADPLVWNSFGIVCAETGQSSQAFRCFIKASELSSKHAEIWSNIGTLYWRSGQLNESKLAYEKAVRINPSTEVVKEASKEYVNIEWDVSELPFVNRPPVVKTKSEVKESEVKSSGFVTTAPVSSGLVNSYAAMLGYFHLFRQMAQSQVMQRNDDDKAAEILTDLSQIPFKRPRPQE